MKIIFLLLLCTNLYSQPDSLKVSSGKCILPNGIFASSEWDDAAELTISDELILFLKQDDQYFYLGIKFINEIHTGIDLYIADSGGNMKMLHVSSALGEKEFTNGQWSDFIWGENNLWTANSIGMISENGKTKFLEPDGFEFQIDKTFFLDKKWFLMIHLKRPELIYPQNATNESKLNWFKVTL